ncbi:MAG: hypothetical protein M3164_06910 [Actinomycetota bacterium]|nr:hypothetical protein [Actinomycetota bacterium]
MQRESIEQALERARAALDSGRGLENTGFWKAVSEARADPAVAREFGHAIAALDRRTFESTVRPHVSEGVGTTVLAAGTAAAVAALLWSQEQESVLVRSLVFLAAFGVLEVSTHSLAHWVVGRLVGIRFTHYFIGGPPPPRPGAKIDYASYLSTPPGKRAVMHASGAVVTKVLPFALIPVALRIRTYPWVIYVLMIVGLVQIVTDVTLSTKNSDWKKVARELRARAGWHKAEGS